VRPPGGWGHRGPAKANDTDSGISKPAIEVVTDSSPPKPAAEAITDPGISKPAIEVITDSCREKPPKPAIDLITDSEPNQSRSISACEPYREVIERGLDRGRNAMAIWQDLVIQ
jgi:hypothetical protein